MRKDQSELTQEVQYWSTLIQTPEFLNTRVEGLFLNRQKEMEDLAKARQNLCNTEYLIALQCCPFYLAQRLWYDDGIHTRFRVFVCDIQFQRESPYYKFYLFDETIKNRRYSKRMKGELKHVAGIQNTFVEEIDTYGERLRGLAARDLVTIKPKHSSMDTIEVISHCAVSSRSHALTSVSPDDLEWFDRIFEMNHLKK